MADERTRTYAVEVTLPNAGNAVRDGMTAEMLINLPGEKGHFLPQSREHALLPYGAACAPVQAPLNRAQVALTFRGRDRYSCQAPIRQRQ